MFTLLFALLSSISLLSNADADIAKWGAHLDFEGRWNNVRSLGDLGLFAPVWQSQTTLLFTDIRGKFQQQEGREGNFGAGLRHMLPSGWNIGAYAYYDIRRSHTGNQFQQIAVGAEALSADFDVRANLYAPVGRVQHETGTIASGVPFVELSNGSLQLVIPQVNTRIERAMKGADIELGWRVPAFDVHALTQLRLFAAGYYFDGSGITDNIAGVRGRLELSFDDIAGWTGARLTLGAELQHDDARGTIGIGLARLRVPLHPHGATPSRNPQERRMTERIVRDVDIVTAEAVGRTTQVASREDVKIDATGQRVSSVRQVSTTSEAVLQQWLNDAGQGSIVVLNSAVSGNAGVTLNPYQALIGGGTALAVAGVSSGVKAVFTAPGGAGSISGGALAQVYLSAGSTLGGLTISNAGTGATVAAQNAPGAFIFDNHIVQTGNDSYGIGFENSDGLRISGNNIRSDSVDGAAIFGRNAADVTIIGNRTMQSVNGTGVFLADVERALIRDNHISIEGVGRAIQLAPSVPGGSAIVSGNTIYAASDYGLVSGLSRIKIDGNSFVHSSGWDIGLIDTVIEAGSTDNRSNRPLATRCNSLGTISGTIGFVDAQNCVFP